MANYIIIGGDGKEYGPVTTNDVRQWLAEGRLSAQSLVKAESDAEFRPLEKFPEFADAFATHTPGIITPLKASADFLERDYELDLVGWNRDVLCFIEVKTRTKHDVKPAEAAVDRHKQRELSLVARDFLRQMPPSCQWRFDVLAVYYDHGHSRPSFELFQNAFPVSYNRGFADSS